MNANDFVAAVSSLRFSNTFNPYTDVCPVHDVDDAPRLRADALSAMLTVALDSSLDSIWIGRDLGHKGGRRTGLALTDDVHLNLHGSRWGVTIHRPTKGKVIAERTAAVAWSVLTQVPVHIFLWNAFPLHPHEDDNPFSNRAHKASERRAGEEILRQLILMLRPQRLVAIGNDAEATALRLADTEEVIKVRHPSYGGQSIFIRQTHELYDLQQDRLSI